MKKILFTSHTANFSKYNRPFIQDLREQGYEVHYASADDEIIENIDRYIKIDFVRSPYRIDKHIRAYKRLCKLLDEENYDLIHTHTPVGSVVTRFATRKLHRKQKKNQKKRTPVIYTSHGFHFYKGAPWLNWLLFYPIEKWLSRDTGLILTINHEDEKIAKKKFHARKVERLDGVGVDLTKFRPVSEDEKAHLRKKYGYKVSDFILIVVAELNKNKDQKFIIENVRELLKDIPELKIALVGEGAWHEKLETLVKKLGLQKVVKFLGYRKDIDKLYQMSDVVVSASWREGLGLNLVEGMACELPAVARDNRGHREIITKPELGYLFQNETEYREAILELYENEKKRKKMGEVASRSVEKFSLERARERMKEIYRRFLEGSDV